MLNPLSILRIQQLYGGPQTISGQDDPSQVLNDPSPYEQMGSYFNNQSVPNPAQQQGNDVQQRLRQLYQPQNTASNDLSKYLQNQPQREEPGKLRQIAALLSGLGTASPAGIENGQPVGFRSDPLKSLQIQDAVKYEPYYRKSADWEQGLKPREYAANQERERNTNERLVAEQTLQKEINQQRADELERAARAREAALEERNKTAQKRAEIAQQRADTYKELARGGTVQTDKDGESWMIYKDGTKEKLDLQKFDAQEIQDMKTHSALVLEAQRAKDAVALESQRQSGKQSNITLQNDLITNRPPKPIAPKPDIQKTEEIFDASGKPTGKKVTTTGKPQPIIQHSPSTGKYRISNDGGRTWQPYDPSAK